MAEALRMNNGKPQLGYLLQFPTAIQAFARVKELGAAKYEKGNWKKGGKPDDEYIDAAMRHMMAFVEGEKIAEDSGCLHLAHAAWNLFALMELNYPGEVYDKTLFDQMMEFWKVKRMVSEPVVLPAPPQIPSTPKYHWSGEWEEAFSGLMERDDIRARERDEDGTYEGSK